jgi:hypothetical protein
VEHVWSIRRHPWCEPWVTCTMRRISIDSSVNLMVKNDFHHIWPCIKPLDGKVGQTTKFDWPYVIGVFLVVPRPITTSIFTKHNFHLIKSKDTRMPNLKTCKNDQWRFIGFKTIPSMSKMTFYRWIFYIFSSGQIFGYVPLNWSLHIPSFTLQKLRDTSMGFVFGFNCHLVLASMFKPIFPHQIHIRKRWLCGVLDLDGLEQWSSPHALNYRWNDPIVGVLNLWKPLEYPHMFTNCNSINQQKLQTLQMNLLSITLVEKCQFKIETIDSGSIQRTNNVQVFDLFWNFKCSFKSLFTIIRKV